MTFFKSKTPAAPADPPATEPQFFYGTNGHHFSDEVNEIFTITTTAEGAEYSRVDTVLQDNYGKWFRVLANNYLYGNYRKITLMPLEGNRESQTTHSTLD